MGLDVESILERLRANLKRRGAEGIQGLARNFRICDTNGSGQLDDEELAKCFRLYKIPLSPAEFDAVMRFFDRSGDVRAALARDRTRARATSAHGPVLTVRAAWQGTQPAA